MGGRASRAGRSSGPGFGSMVRTLGSVNSFIVDALSDRTTGSAIFEWARRSGDMSGSSSSFTLRLRGTRRTRPRLLSDLDDFPGGEDRHLSATITVPVPLSLGMSWSARPLFRRSILPSTPLHEALDRLDPTEQPPHLGRVPGSVAPGPVPLRVETRRDRLKREALLALLPDVDCVQHDPSFAGAPCHPAHGSPSTLLTIPWGDEARRAAEPAALTRSPDRSPDPHDHIALDHAACRCRLRPSVPPRSPDGRVPSRRPGIMIPGHRRRWRGPPPGGLPLQAVLWVAHRPQEDRARASWARSLPVAPRGVAVLAVAPRRGELD
jgi:hypothetical protein